MSPEDLEIVRRAYDAFARGDLGEVRSFLSPDIEWRTTPNVPFEGTYRGTDEFFHGMTDWIEPFEAITTEVEEITNAGDHAVVQHRMRGRGRDSGVEVNLVIWQVVTVRNGQLVRMQDYQTREEAMAAAAG
jgi:ketosteroid isomerase-like protein